MDERVAGEPRREVPELVRAGQVAINEEEAGFYERRLLGKLLDGDAPVAEDPFLAIEESDRALRRGRVHERRIKRDDARFGSKVLNIECLLALGPDGHRRFKRRIAHLELSFVRHVASKVSRDTRLRAES